MRNWAREGYAADADDQPSDLRGLLVARPAVLPAFALIVVAGLFATLASPQFLSPRNVTNLVQATTLTSLVAIAQALVMRTGGVDLSLGAVAALASVVIAAAASVLGFPGISALGLGLVAGLACGLVNGGLIVGLKVTPSLVTFATLTIASALAVWLSAGGTLRLFDGDTVLMLPNYPIFEDAGLRITTGSLLLIAVAVAVWFGAKERFQPSTAGLIYSYAAAGAICAAVGLLLVARLGTATPAAAAPLLAESIAAALLGGSGLYRRRISVVGAIFGAATVVALRNGMTMTTVDMLPQTLAVGALIVVALGIDRWLADEE
jgi:fructose transport system permease protein